MWEWIENIVGFIASVLAGLFFAMASILFIAYLLLVLTK